MVADAEVGREVVVDRELRGGVVGHHRPRRVALQRRLRARRPVVLGEPAHRAAGDLLLDVDVPVPRILRLDQRRALRPVHRPALAVRLVRQPLAQTLQIGAAAVDREVAQHVVERPVLHHQDDDVVDLGDKVAADRHRPGQSSLRARADLTQSDQAATGPFNARKVLRSYSRSRQDVLPHSTSTALSGLAERPSTEVDEINGHLTRTGHQLGWLQREGVTEPQRRRTRATTAPSVVCPLPYSAGATA